MAAAGWKPTVDNYLGRVTKPRILEAVREAKGEQSVQLIDHLKKGDMAREAERLLDGTGWLPEPLRLVEVDATGQDADGKAEALPEFLATAEDEAAADAEEEQPNFEALMARGYLVEVSRSGPSTRQLVRYRLTEEVRSGRFDERQLVDQGSLRL